jgi:hypothetical protein
VCPRCAMIRVQPEACSTDRYESNEAYECHEGNEILQTNGAGLDEISMLSCSMFVPSLPRCPCARRGGAWKFWGGLGNIGKQLEPLRESCCPKKKMPRCPTGRNKATLRITKEVPAAMKVTEQIRGSRSSPSWKRGFIPTDVSPTKLYHI